MAQRATGIGYRVKGNGFRVYLVCLVYLVHLVFLNLSKSV
jgi:hypothetical protein